MRIVILEDELYSYRLLRQMLLELDPQTEIVGPFTTVADSRDYFGMRDPMDLIIADIQLNDGLSFEALDAAPPTVPVIFTTAYDEHALKAFEYRSLSYLLKPIDEDELKEAIKKARGLSNSLSSPSHKGRGVASPGNGSVGLSPLPLWEGKGEGLYLSRFIAKTALGERVIIASAVRYIVSENKTTYICHLDGTTYPIAISLADLEPQLNPREFMRVNRKYIIPASQVQELRNLENGRELLVLKGDNPPEVVISRDMKKAVRQWLG